MTLTCGLSILAKKPDHSVCHVSQVCLELPKTLSVSKTRLGLVSLLLVYAKAYSQVYLSSCYCIPYNLLIKVSTHPFAFFIKKYCVLVINVTMYAISFFILTI